MRFSDCLARYPDSDKLYWHSYGIVYDILLNRWAGMEVDVLEVGVWSGGSTKAFEEFFAASSRVLAMDIDFSHLKHGFGPNVTLRCADAFDPSTLDWLLAGPAPFDLVVDDSLHDLRSHDYLLGHAMRLLKPGGLMILEDAAYSEAELQSLCRAHGAIYIRNQHNLGYAREVNPRDHDASCIVVKSV